MRSRPKPFRLVAKGLAAVLALAALAECGGSEANPVDPSNEAAEAVEVQTAEARTMKVDRTVEVVGALLAHEQATFTAKVAGTIWRTPVDFGDRVRRGQQLVAMEPEEYRIAVDRARAALAEALAAVGLPPDGDETTVAPEQTPSVMEAAAALADARTKLESAAMLMKTRDIAEQRYLELQKTVEMREAGLRAANDRVLVQLAAVRSRRAELALAVKRLSDTLIQAPFEGSVVERHVSPGEHVREDAPLITLAQTNPLRLRARIPETGAGAARPGLPLEFATDAFPGRTFQATVTSVSPALDPASRSLVAEAIVDNSAGLLKPGMFAKIEVVVAGGVETVMAPKQALLEFGGLTKLFAVGEDGGVEERAVRTGVEKEGWIEILDDALKPGEKVAVERLEELAPGVRVRYR